MQAPSGNTAGNNIGYVSICVYQQSRFNFSETFRRHGITCKTYPSRS